MCCLYSRVSLFYSFHSFLLIFFFFNDPAPTEIYTLSLHDALPIFDRHLRHARLLDDADELADPLGAALVDGRSEEHTSELQSLRHLVCRLLLEKKKKKKKTERPTEHER